MVDKRRVDDVDRRVALLPVRQHVEPHTDELRLVGGDGLDLHEVVADDGGEVERELDVELDVRRTVADDVSKEFGVFSTTTSFLVGFQFVAPKPRLPTTRLVKSM